jgi:hypothetical protein
MRMRTGINWLRVENLRDLRKVRNFLSAERLSASQEGLSSMESVNLKVKLSLCLTKYHAMNRYPVLN